MRVAILVSAPIDPTLLEKIDAGLHPRQDFLALAEVLDADLITPSRPLRVPMARVSRSIDLFYSAWAAFEQRLKYDVIISDMDRVGLILALMLKFARAPTSHIVICHGKMARPYDRWLIHRFQLQRYISRFVCYGPEIARRLRETLGLSDRQVVTVRHPADHRFWRPQPGPQEQLIISAGMLRRDYPTLIEAVRGQPVSLTIAAYSPWVWGQKNPIRPETLPPNVRVTRCDYLQLRDLYARALCVAVPLHRSESQSGSLVIYEAMAMGKPVLVTRTQGQVALEIIRDGETGYYIAPGDVQGWRDKIHYLWERPEEARAMGQRARRVVEDRLNLDSYIDEMASMVRAVAAERQAA